MGLGFAPPEVLAGLPGAITSFLWTSVPLHVRKEHWTRGSLRFSLNKDLEQDRDLNTMKILILLLNTVQFWGVSGGRDLGILYFSFFLMEIKVLDSKKYESSTRSSVLSSLPSFLPNSSRWVYFLEIFKEALGGVCLPWPCVWNEPCLLGAQSPRRQS